MDIVIDEGHPIRISDRISGSGGKTALQINAFGVRGKICRGDYVDLLPYGKHNRHITWSGTQEPSPIDKSATCEGRFLRRQYGISERQKMSVASFKFGRRERGNPHHEGDVSAKFNLTTEELADVTYCADGRAAP